MNPKTGNMGLGHDMHYTPAPSLVNCGGHGNGNQEETQARLWGLFTICSVCGFRSSGQTPLLSSSAYPGACCVGPGAQLHMKRAVCLICSVLERGVKVQWLWRNCPKQAKCNQHSRQCQCHFEYYNFPSLHQLQIVILPINSFSGPIHMFFTNANK